ncbi:MAG: cytochrome c biogenesis protein CcsA [Anaerolineae bacterium]
MANETVLYFAANLVLFALVLLSWGHLSRRHRVASRVLRGTLLLFLGCQATALLWSGARLGPWALAHPYLSAMFLVESVVIVYLVLEKLTTRPSVSPFVVSLAFIIHSYGLVVIPPPVAEALNTSPFARSPWYLFHLLSALVGCSAYTCAGGSAIGYLTARLPTRSALAAGWLSLQDRQTFTRRALVIVFPWLSASLMTRALWTQLAWGSHWTWHPAEVSLLVVWLILTMTLHARSMPRWQGRPLALLSLLGFSLAMLSLPLLAQGPAPTW